jgi:hypothetical protein
MINVSPLAATKACNPSQLPSARWEEAKWFSTAADAQ